MVPFDPARLSWDRLQVLYIGLYYIVLCGPLFLLRTDRLNGLFRCRGISGLGLCLGPSGCGGRVSAHVLAALPGRAGTGRVPYFAAHCRRHSCLRPGSWSGRLLSSHRAEHPRARPASADYPAQDISLQASRYRAPVPRRGAPQHVPQPLCPRRRVQKPRGTVCARPEP